MSSSANAGSVKQSSSSGSTPIHLGLVQQQQKTLLAKGTLSQASLSQQQMRQVQLIHQRKQQGLLQQQQQKMNQNQTSVFISGSNPNNPQLKKVIFIKLILLQDIYCFHIFYRYT